jgi:PIN domain nuclease of toxin-antitoxin system
MTYLIDTHVLIWFVENDPKLSASVRQILENPANIVLVSHASFWEITIKKSIGKLDVTLLPQALERVLSRHLILTLDFKMTHYETLYSLPFYHQDPFDRMIISQAISDKITIVTQDRKFKLYEELVNVLWND